MKWDSKKGGDIMRYRRRSRRRRRRSRRRSGRKFYAMRVVRRS